MRLIQIQSSKINTPPAVFIPLINLKNSIPRLYLLQRSSCVPFFVDWTPALEYSESHALSKILKKIVTSNHNNLKL